MDNMRQHFGEDHKVLPRELAWGCTKRLNRSLKTKWKVIKYNVLKFCGVYTINLVLLLREFGTSLEDIFDCMLDLYKVKHPKQQAFVFIHCWRLLKDVP